jgi:hypothetical protein
MGASLPFMATDSKTEHLDAHRLHAIAVERTQGPSNLFDMLSGWVDPDTLQAVAILQFRWLKKQVGGDAIIRVLLADPDKADQAVEEIFGFVYADAFLMGAQFQAAGGHRD